MTYNMPDDCGECSECGEQYFGYHKCEGKCDAGNCQEIASAYTENGDFYCEDCFFEYMIELENEDES